MKKIIFILLVSLISMTALATTPFDQVLSFFNQGTLPGQEIIGAWSGRCYSKDTPTQPYGILLVAAWSTDTPGPNNGPAFPAPKPQTTLNIAVANENGTSEAADRYDQLTDADRRGIKQFIASSEFADYKSSAENNSLVVVNESTNLRNMYRKYQNYFVVNAVPLQGGDSPTGNTWSDCYFFKKVQ